MQRLHLVAFLQDVRAADNDSHNPTPTGKRPSYGEMIACDNKKCAIEWFHVSCVNMDPSKLNRGTCGFASAFRHFVPFSRAFHAAAPAALHQSLGPLRGCDVMGG